LFCLPRPPLPSTLLSSLKPPPTPTTSTLSLHDALPILGGVIAQLKTPQTTNTTQKSIKDTCGMSNKQRPKRMITAISVLLMPNRSAENPPTPPPVTAAAP